MAGHKLVKFCLAGLLGWAGCGGTPAPQPPASTGAEGSPAATDGSSQATTTDPAQLIRNLATDAHNPFPQPAGPFPDPASEISAIRAFMQRMASQELQGETPQEVGQSIALMMAARVVAAEKLLQLAATQDDVKLEAQQARIDGLRALAVVGPNGTEDLFRRECQAMIEQDGPLALFARQAVLMLDVDLIGGGEQTDATSILTKVDDLLSRLPKLTDEAYATLEQSALVLERSGHPQVVDQVLAKLRTQVQKEGPESAFQARWVKLEGTIPLLRLQHRLGELGIKNTPETAQTIEREAKGLLANPQMLQRDTLGMCSQAAQTLEFLGYPELSRTLYAQMATAFAGHSEEKLAKAAADSARVAEVRLGLVGKPLVIEGTLLNGTPFDWKNYAGKVVLVDFWATWCGPCLAELPNIREAYKRFHDQGFDVVGVNMDDDRARVDEFLKNKPLPWTTVVSGDETLGFENPNATQCGVEAIPFLVLIGRDGNVAAIHVGGERLVPAIEAQLKQSPPATSQTGG